MLYSDPVFKNKKTLYPPFIFLKKVYYFSNSYSKSKEISKNFSFFNNNLSTSINQLIYILAKKIIYNK